MDEATDWSLDEKTDRVWDRVIDYEWCDLEVFSDLDRLIALILTEIGKLGSHISLFELDELISHSSTIERSRSAQLFHEIVDRSEERRVGKECCG